MASTFEFVPIDPSNLKPGNASLIRSITMRGKNKREGSRRSQEKKRREVNRKDVALDTVAQTPLLHWLSLRYISMGPLSCPDISHEAQTLILNAALFHDVDPASTPLNCCIDFKSKHDVTLRWLFGEAIFLHAILGASYAIDDILRPAANGQPRAKTTFYQRKTLALLRQKMDKENVYQDDDVLNVILQLAYFSAIFGDWNATAAHLGGMHKIILLRGGQDFLQTRSKLHFKLDRSVAHHSLFH